MYLAGDVIKNWRQRLFAIQGSPVPCLAYYRNPGQQGRPTGILFLKKAHIQVKLQGSSRYLAMLSCRLVNKS